MNEDKTILVNTSIRRQSATDEDKTVLFKLPAITVNLTDLSGHLLESYVFSNSFTLGRSADNSIAVDNPLISRHHLEVKWETGCWRIFDLKSTHGLFINDRPVQEQATLTLPISIKLGIAPLILRLENANPALELPETISRTAYEKTPEPELTTNSPATRAEPTVKLDLSPEQIKKRLLQNEDTEDMGEHTIMVRRLIREDRIVRSKNYKKTIWVLAAISLLAASLVGYQQLALSNARMIAINMFYDVKTLEVSLSQAEVRLEESDRQLGQTMREISGERFKVELERIKLAQQKIAEEKQHLEKEKLKLTAMKAKYQDYINEINFLKIRFPTAAQYERELIVRVARGFGESELELPDDFVDEVQKYIKNWQSSSRMQLAMKNLEDNNYAPLIADALLAEGLPLYFLYLPMQESNFDTRAIGPETRFGIAKGAWQFLSTTGQEYGLSAGPLANSREYDEMDARFDFRQATLAGAKYLKYIYSIQTQASGLLVTASYNYGHNRVRSMIEEMPDNPRDKNFWKFIKQYQIPKETYDYVFYIFSAAVIGEDPKHFGFNFKPPLLYASLDPK